MDLLHLFLGGTKKAIAAAFAEARAWEAFLVFEEADSLLGDRVGALCGSKIGRVDEMLAWTDRYPRPFACTTNLPNRLDPASLRRFLMKLRLG